MNESFVTSIVESRRIDAIAAPTIPRWRSLAMMAKQIADAIEETDPNSIMVVTHRAIYQEAFDRMTAMQPKEIPA